MKPGAALLIPILLWVGRPVFAAEVAFGDLPPGAVSTNVVTAVRAEICRDHLFDPALVDVRLPRDYRLILAAEYAKSDPGVADLLKSSTKHAAYAVGSLCFMSVGSFEVDGKRVQSDGPIAMAFWWVHAEGPRDPRMQGKVDWLQLASWYPQSIGQRAAVLASDPMAQFTDLAVTEVEPNQWRVRLALPTESIEGEIRASGQRVKRNKPEPGFMSVPFASKDAGSFWVITYFGHHHQSARGAWYAKGSGIFTDAFEVPGEAAAFETYFQDGWSALSGLYTP